MGYCIMQVKKRFTNAVHLNWSAMLLMATTALFLLMEKQGVEKRTVWQVLLYLFSLIRWQCRESRYSLISRFAYLFDFFQPVRERSGDQPLSFFWSYFSTSLFSIFLAITLLYPCSGQIFLGRFISNIFVLLKTEGQKCACEITRL